MSNSNPRVAILGGTGFAGRNVRNLFVDRGIEIGVFSRTTGCDLLDLPAAWSKIDAFRPTHMINCAAIVGSINYVSDFSADVVDVNTRMLLNLYKMAQQMREVVVVNPVANCAYPGVMDTYDEKGFWDGPVHPSVLSYGTTRRLMLVLSKCYYDQYGVRSVNLIVPNMYGPYDSTNPNKTHALNALIIKFVRAVKQNLPSIEIWGTGKPVREWLYIKDFAEIMRRVVEGQEHSLSPVNIAQNRGYSVVELVDKLRDQVRFQGKIEYNTRFQDGSLKKVMDDHLFRQQYPDFRFTDIDTGVAETVAYYQSIL
jgi:GDP-L-fucose synthase